jgi:hypothetical protein
MTLADPWQAFFVFKLLQRALRLRESADTVVRPYIKIDCQPQRLSEIGESFTPFRQTKRSTSRDLPATARNNPNTRGGGDAYIKA